MRESVRLGRIAGVRIGLNLSVLVIVVVVAASLAIGRFPSAFPGRSGAAYATASVIAAVLFLASLLAHELAHAVVAKRNGIGVESITLWLFGGVAQLESEPRSPGADFRVAVVGPLTSLVVGVVFGGVALALTAGGSMGLAAGVFAYLAGVNVVLAVFNLFPAAPLDGGRVLRAGLWAWRHDRLRAAVIAARAGRVFGFVLVGLGILQTGAGLGFGGLWLVLIGLFLVNAATAEEQASRLSQATHGMRVRDVMTARPVTAEPDQTLIQFVTETVWTHRHSTYPLIDSDGRLTGLATLNRVRDAPDERRHELTLADIACRADDVPTAHPDEPLDELLPRMAGCSDGRAVVVDDSHRVIGIVSPSDVVRSVHLSGLRGWGPYGDLRGADLAAIIRPRS
jgi:Zn-dependent protease/CBS domain-containing protein